MKFSIGLTTDVQELTTLNIPFPGQPPYRPYTSIAGMNGLGYPIWVGYPMFAWRWNMLTMEQLDVFLALCGDGPSAEVYARTLTDRQTADGLNFTYRTFLCVMWRPSATPVPGRKWAEVSINFTRCIMQDEP